MRSFFSIVLIFATSFLLVNCKSPKVETPDVPNYDPSGDIQKTLDMILACNKNESELTISDEAEENTIVIEDKIESQDIETMDCEGQVKKTHGPVRNLTKAIAVEPPKVFSDDVTYIQVENPRTCATQVFDTTESLSETTVTTKDGEKIDIPVLSSESNRDGNARILVDDSDVKYNLFTNVKDGTNILKVSYFGKCLKKSPTVEEKPKSEAYRCQEAELLGTKEVLVKVQVDRPEIPGVKKVNGCFK